MRDRDGMLLDALFEFAPIHSRLGQDIARVRAAVVRGNATGNSVNRSTRMFYPNENNGRDRYEAPGNWRRRLMKTKREAEGPGEDGGTGVVKLTGETRLPGRSHTRARIHIYRCCTHTRIYTHWTTADTLI